MNAPQPSAAAMRAAKAAYFSLPESVRMGGRIHIPSGHIEIIAAIIDREFSAVRDALQLAQIHIAWARLKGTTIEERRQLATSVHSQIAPALLSTLAQ